MTDSEARRLNNLRIELEVMKKLQDVFAEATKNTSAFNQVTEDIRKVNEELANLKQFGDAEGLDVSIFEEDAHAKLRAEELLQENLALTREEARTNEEIVKQVARDNELEAEEQHQEALSEFAERRRQEVEDDAEHRIREARRTARELKRQARALADFVTGVSEAIGTALGQSVFKVKDVWKVALKELVDLIAGVYKNILRATIAVALATLPKNFAAAAKATIGISLISAAQAVAHSLIDSAAVGAKIDRSGLVNVHAGETIVPASVSRTTRNEFRNKLLGSDSAPAAEGIESGDVDAGSSGNKGITIEGDMVLINPQVDDARYWRSVVDNQLDEVEINRNKRFNKR